MLIFAAFESFKAIESTGTTDDTQWLTYWVVFAAFVWENTLVTRFALTLRTLWNTLAGLCYTGFVCVCPFL